MEPLCGAGENRLFCLRPFPCFALNQSILTYLNRAHSSETKIETGFRFFVGGALWIGLLSAFGVLAASAYRCLEGTDEASWVICAANPWASPGYGIFFGFFLHPLWAITGHVAPFRIAGMLMILLAAGIFSFFLIQAGPRLGARDSLWRHRFIVFPSIGIAALTRYAVGIRTPGYDWVVLFEHFYSPLGGFGRNPWIVRIDLLVGCFSVPWASLGFSWESGSPCRDTSFLSGSWCFAD